MQVADTTSIASRIELAFQSASSSTGTSFDYLVKTAARESAFNPTAKARTSSATGLFQFIEIHVAGNDEGSGTATWVGKILRPDRAVQKRQILRKRSPDAPRNTRPA
ncbi:transglycosylase SLT domain-containing protein [Roseibium salinum]|uniref:Transglycosylase SLT domain-containing protein n=1 Tax=Roseibium salinum TaxID=1604349 RepID=A0ABT3QZI9_9HYPH|nr:transglycosylase SLT domain-containing protein [Roseibium sp. DSM 29163]